MNLKEYIDLLDKNKKSSENIKSETKDLSIQEIEEQLTNNKLSGLKERYLADKIVSNIDISLYDNLNQNINTDPDKTKYYILSDTRSKLIQNGIHKDIPSIDNLNYDEASKIMDKYLDSNEAKDIYYESYKSSLVFSISSNPKESYDKISSFINPSTEKNIISDVEKYNKELEEKGNRNYEYILNNEIDEIIKSSSSKELNESLNYAKENILKARNADDLADDSRFAEDVIRIKKNIVNTKNVESLENDNYFSKYMEYDSGTYMFKSGVTSFDEKLNSEISKHEIKLSDNTKNIIKNAIKKLDLMKDYKSGESLLNMNEYASEEGVKKYAFKNLIDINSDIKEAIQNKDQDRIIDLSKKHKEMTKNMDNIINDLKGLNPSNYPANISIARTKDAPIKYAEDYKSSSLVNGMWHLLAFSKSSGISIDDLLEKPIDSILKYTEKNKGLSEIEDLGKNGDIDFISNITDNKKINSIRKSFQNKYNNFRSFEFLSSIDNKNLENNTLSFQYVKQAKFVSFFTDKNKSLSEFTSSLDSKAFKNILLNQDKSRSYEEIIKNGVDATNLDPNKFMEKVDIFQKACKEKKFNGKENQIMDAIKLASKEMALNRNSLLSDKFNDICKIGGIENYKAIRSMANSKDIAPFIKGQYDFIKSNGLNKDNIKQTANMLKSVSDQYNKRSFFGKIFRGEGRAENKLIKDIKADLLSNGFNNVDVEKFIKGEIDNKEFTNAFNGNEIDNEDIKKHIVISDKEFQNDEINIIQDKEKVKSLNLDKTIDMENIL